MAEVDLQNAQKIGENDHGYSFFVAQISGSWYGFAHGKISNSESMIFMLPGCDELNDFRNVESEIRADAKTEIIRRTGAVAQSVEHGYGGIKRWFVEENLRGKPSDYACAECGSVGCRPDKHDFDGIDFY